MLDKSSNIKPHENPSCGSRVVLCGRTGRLVALLIVAFRNFANAPKNFTFAHAVYIYVLCMDRSKQKSDLSVIQQ
jgi:hypothetical protein